MANAPQGQASPHSSGQRGSGFSLQHGSPAARAWSIGKWSAKVGRGEKTPGDLEAMVRLDAARVPGLGHCAWELAETDQFWGEP